MPTAPSASMMAAVQAVGQKMRGILLVMALAVVAACASGSSVVTGATRPAIAADHVRIYTEPPPVFEVIGIVSTDAAGWTTQGEMDLAMQDLRRRAGAMGANGILLEQLGSQVGGVVGQTYGNTTMYAPSTSTVARGRAVYVPPN